MNPRRLTMNLGTVAAAVLLSACANLAPPYQRPVAPVPAQWAGTAAPAGAAAATAPAPGPAAALPALGWQQLLLDTRLRQTVALALDNSRPLRQALLAIEQARASAQVQDAAALPTVKASASSSSTRTPGAASATGSAQLSRSTSLGLGITAFELDLFGRVRNLQDAALETLLATEEAARSTRLSLVAEVAHAWLTLAADQAQLALARQTLASQQRTLQLTQQRHDAGADSGLTLAQVQTAVASAQRDVAARQVQVQQDRHALDLLAGTAVPDTWLPTADGLATPAATTAATSSATPAAQLLAVPAGLSSDVLLQRPDVRAAEHQLRAAHADIGRARAALYPSISLTAQAGTASRSLADLFTGGAWSFLPSISLPLFDGGAAQAGVQQAEVARDLRVASYEQAVQTAFREVADALAVRSGIGEQLAAQAALVQAATTAQALAEARWQAGATSYLEVLDAQRTQVAARQALITLQQAEQANRLTLFKVLGGGETAAQAPA